MANNDVTITIKAETELEQARAEAAQVFDRIGSDARQAGNDLEGPFERAAAGIRSSFDRVDTNVSAALGGLDDTAARAAAGIEDPFTGAALEVASAFDSTDADVRRSLDGLDGVAARAADGLADPFQQAAADIESVFDGVDDELRRDFERAEAAATSAAGGIESEFETAAARIPGSFDGVRSDLRSTFDQVEGDAASAADGIATQFSGIADGIDIGNIGGTLTGGLQSLLGAGGPVLGLVGTAGLFLGDELAEGISGGFNRKRSDVEIGIKTGLDRLDLASTGRTAGEAYAAGFGDGIGDLRFEVAAVAKELEGFDLGDTELQVNKELQLLQGLLGIELPQSVDIAQRALATGLAPTVSDVADGLVTLKQELPLNADEAVDSLSEYAATFGGLNLTLEQFIGLQVEAQKSGQFENIPQANEAIRELNTRLTETDELRDVFAAMDLDVDSLRNRLVSGDLVGVLQSIRTAVADIDNEGRRRELLGQIFGSSVEDSTDRLAALDTLIVGLTTNFDNMAGSAERGTIALEGNVTGLGRLKRDTVGAGSFLGTWLDNSAEGWYRLGDAINDSGGPMEAIARGLGGIVGSGDEATTTIEGVAGSLDGAVLGSRAFTGSLDDIGDSAALAADGIGSTEEAVAGLVDELEGLLNFSADQLMRNIADASDDLAAALEGTDNSLIGLNGTISTGSEEGRQLQAAFEGLSEQQAIAAQRFADGEITALEYQRAQAAVRAELDSVTAGASLTAGQVQGLIDKYNLTPDQVNTLITAEDAASLTLAEISRLIGLIPNEKVITVRGRTVNFRGFVDQFAEGGTAHGIGLVGEEGYELARQGSKMSLVGVGGPQVLDFTRPTTIVPHEETVRLLAARIPKFADGTSGFRSELPNIADQLDGDTAKLQAAVRAGVAEALAGSDRGPAVNIEQWNVTDGRDSFADLRNLEAVYRMSA